MQRLLHAEPQDPDLKPRDEYLKPEDKDRKVWRKIQSLALEKDATAFTKLSEYVLEAQRVSFDIPLVRTFQVTQSDGVSATATPASIEIPEEDRDSDRDSDDEVLVNGSMNGQAGKKSVVHTLNDGKQFILEIVSYSTAKAASYPAHFSTVSSLTASSAKLPSLNTARTSRLRVSGSLLSQHSTIWYMENPKMEKPLRRKISPFSRLPLWSSTL